MAGKKQRPDTQVTHGGRRKEWLRGMVNVPVSRTSTVMFDCVADMHAAYPPRDGRLSYGRNGTETQWALAEALTELEPGAAGTRLYPSGAAAVAMALTTALSPGDELLMVDSAYGPTRSFCETELKRLGVTTRVYDPEATASELQEFISDKTRAIFMESPGSLTFEVQDVPGICAMAKQRGLITLLDNTWATPLFFRAIEAGADFAILACTKYIAGHSDVMLGSVTTTAEHFDRLSKVERAFGQYVSPDDAYLATRGLRTLGVRLRRHEESALFIANWLKDQPQVDCVLHPAFELCPGHEFWFRDFHGSTGLFSFVLKGGSKAARDELIDRLELFGIGYSWGGFESLAVPADPPASREFPTKAEGPIVRLHIGLEDPEDLIEDLAQALAGYPSSS
jgi:cystathionine beta-lyase